MNLRLVAEQSKDPAMSLTSLAGAIEAIVTRPYDAAAWEKLHSTSVPPMARTSLIRLQPLPVPVPVAAAGPGVSNVAGARSCPNLTRLSGPWLLKPRAEEHPMPRSGIRDGVTS